MAKRSKKEPNEAAGTPSQPFQIPEVGRNPIDSVAATHPRAGAPFAKGKSPVPAKGADFDPDDVQRTRANVLAPILVLNRPALGAFTSMATILLGDCAIANSLGVRQPVKMKVSFSEDYKYCFLMPVHHTAEKAIDVTYHKGRAHINLWGPFEGRNKSVEKGFKESYHLWMTDEPIDIHDVTGYALYFSMEVFKKGLLGKRDGDVDADELTSPAASAGSAKAGKSSPAPNTTGKPAETESAESEESLTQLEMLESELADAAESAQMYLDMLDQKDAQIKQLQEQLKALQEKKG